MILPSISYPVTTVGTSELVPVGSMYWQPDELLATAQKGNGGRLWVYVKNGEGATAFAAGQLIRRKLGSNTKESIIHAAGATFHPSACIGVAQHAIAAGSYGWILKQGVGTILTDDTGVTVDQQLLAGNNGAGTFDSSATATTAGIGYAIDTIGASTTGLGYINCPG